MGLAGTAVGPARNRHTVPQRGQFSAKIAQDQLIGRLSPIDGHKVARRIFVDVAGVAGWLRVPVIFDVHPADGGLHREWSDQVWYQTAALVIEIV